MERSPNGNPIIRFKAFVVREYSATPKVEPLGEAECEMEWYPQDPDGSMEELRLGEIEWRYRLNMGGARPGEWEIEHIGIEGRGPRITGYDGCFSLPKEAIGFLKQMGFNTSEVE